MKFTLNVLMFGQTGVGKTSLLAAMFYSLQSDRLFENIRAQSTHSHELDSALTALKRYIRTLADGNPFSLPGTPVDKRYVFNLSVPGMEHSIDIIFTDMPGEWLDDPNKRDYWISLIRSNDIIINVISAPAVMESNREYNEDINKPSRFTEYIKQAIEGADKSHTRFIYLVPVKCERYDEKSGLLTGALKEVYHNLRMHIRRNAHACFTLPVSTLGSVEFDQFKLTNGHPLAIFKLKDRQSTAWKPKSHDELASHIIVHALNNLEASFPLQTKAISPLTGQLTRSSTRRETLEEPSKSIPKKYYLSDVCGCFGPDTLITLENGQEMPISMIEPGTRVMSLNPGGEYESCRVLKVKRYFNIPLIEVNIGNSIIRVTREHLFLIDEKWKKAGQLAEGEAIIGYCGQRHQALTSTVQNVSLVPVATDAYNLIVEQNSNYLAGGVVVSSFVHFILLRQTLNRIWSMLQTPSLMEVTNAL